MGPPGAEPLGTGGGSRAWALSEKRRDPEITACPPAWPHPRLPSKGGLLAAHLWPGGSSTGPGLFSHSVVWWGWWAPEAGTEVEGSLVAL